MATERSVAKALIEAGLRRGFVVSVQDGEEWVVKRSRDAAEALKALFSTGMDRVRFRDDRQQVVATYLLVGGNSAEELIADYSDNPIANELYREAMAESGFN